MAELYGWNTVGCIAGSLGAGFVLIPWLGASYSGALLSGISLAIGLMLLAASPRGLLKEAGIGDWVLVAVVGLLTATAGDPYYRLIRGRAERITNGALDLNRHIEEPTGTTTAFGTRGESRSKHLWINGYGMTSLTPVTKLMAHLPIWLADQPRDALVICFGMGTSFRSSSRHDGLNVRVVELVPGVPECFDFFHADAAQVLKRPGLEVVIDDGRNYLLMHPETYDAITIDPAARRSIAPAR